MQSSVRDRIVRWLNENSVSFESRQHAPTMTSAESAVARGESLHIGGKAIVLQAGDEFYLFVLSAALRLDTAAIRKYLKIKKTRFASRDELHELTGLEPGAVPPFGQPILPLSVASA